MWSLFVRVLGCGVVRNMNSTSGCLGKLLDVCSFIRMLELGVTSCIIIKVLEEWLVSNMFIRVMGVLESESV